MTAQGHLVFSAGCLLLAHHSGLLPHLAQGEPLPLLGMTLLGALLPDLDHPDSRLGRAFRVLSVPLSRLFGHRGFTHSLLAAGLLEFGLRQGVPQLPGALREALLIGYLSHIAADMLTPAGVPLLWPLRPRFRLPLLPSGSQWGEALFCGAILLVSLYWSGNLPFLW